MSTITMSSAIKQLANLFLKLAPVSLRPHQHPPADHEPDQPAQHEPDKGRNKIRSLDRLKRLSALCKLLADRIQQVDAAGVVFVGSFQSVFHALDIRFGFQTITVKSGV